MRVVLLSDEGGGGLRRRGVAGDSYGDNGEIKGREGEWGRRRMRLT